MPDRSRCAWCRKPVHPKSRKNRISLCATHVRGIKRRYPGRRIFVPALGVLNDPEEERWKLTKKWGRIL